MKPALIHKIVDRASEMTNEEQDMETPKTEEPEPFAMFDGQLHAVLFRDNRGHLWLWLKHFYEESENTHNYTIVAEGGYRTLETLRDIMRQGEDHAN